MKVIPIESSTSFRFHGPRTEPEPERPADQQPERSDDEFDALLTVLTGLGFSAWLPTLVWCVVAQQVLPAYLVASSEIVGAIIGVLLYHSTPPDRVSCVPATTIPRAQPVACARKAA